MMVHRIRCFVYKIENIYANWVKKIKMIILVSDD